MSEHTTMRLPDRPEPIFADQESVIVALAAMAEAFGHLPGAYIMVHRIPPVQVKLQLSSPAAFEQWRQALGIDPESVELHTYNGETWLEAEGAFSGASVHLCGHGIQVAEPAEAVASR